jgi:hypothetical protein
LAQAGSTGSLTTAHPKKLAVSPVGITFGQRRPCQPVQARGGGAQACLAHVLQGSFKGRVPFRPINLLYVFDQNLNACETQ